MDIARALFYQLPLPLKVPVMVCICLVQGVALLAGVALLQEVCHCGGGLGDPLPSCLEGSLLLAAFR